MDRGKELKPAGIIFIVLGVAVMVLSIVLLNYAEARIQSAGWLTRTFDSGYMNGLQELAALAWFGIVGGFGLLMLGTILYAVGAGQKKRVSSG